jgi:DNA-binding response OmpR family regulator
LIVEDEPAIRDILYVLLARLGCEGDVACNDQQALAMVRREHFDAVLLDLRCTDLPPEQVVSEIREIRPSLIGRVLVVTGEIADPQTVELIERYCLAHVSRDRVLDDAWFLLRSLLGMEDAPDTAA